MDRWYSVPGHVRPITDGMSWFRRCANPNEKEGAFYFDAVEWNPDIQGETVIGNYMTLDRVDALLDSIFAQVDGDRSAEWALRMAEASAAGRELARQFATETAPA